MAAIAAAIVALVAAVRGRRAHAGAILKRLGMAVVAYETLVLIVAAASPQRVLREGDPWCFDDCPSHPCPACQTRRRLISQVKGRIALFIESDRISAGAVVDR